MKNKHGKNVRRLYTELLSPRADIENHNVVYKILRKMVTSCEPVYMMMCVDDYTRNVYF